MSSTSELEGNNGNLDTQNEKLKGAKVTRELKRRFCVKKTTTRL